MENLPQKATSENLQVQQVKRRDYLIRFTENKEEQDLITSIFASNSIVKGCKDSLNLMIDTIAKWRWMAGVGTTNQDEDELAAELLIISQFVIDNYSELTIDEIKLAINLSVADKLDCDNRTFNVFSPMYVSRILNAYREYKRKNVVGIMQRKDNLEKKQGEKPLTVEKRREAMIELIDYLYERYKTKGAIEDYFSTLYKFFRKIGILNPDKAMIKDAVEYGKGKAQKDIGSLMSNFHVWDDNGRKESLQKRYARDYCVQKLFDTEGIENIKSRIELKHFE